jgi:hypothetical protein
MLFTIQQKAQCVWWLAESQSYVQVQRKFQAKYGINVKTPDQKSLERWRENFLLTGSVENKNRACSLEVRGRKISELK